MNELPYVRNERGGVLLYVLMIMMVLAILTPVMLNTVSSGSLRDNKIAAETVANQVAVSGMESLLQYYSAYTGSSKRTHLNEYSGWGLKTIRQPDGTTIAYDLFVLADNGTKAAIQPPNLTIDKDYKVRITAEYKGKQKQLTYLLPVSNSGGSGGGGGIAPVTPTTNPLMNPATGAQNPDKMIIVSEYPGGAVKYQEDFNKLLPTAWNRTYSGAACSDPNLWYSIQSYIDNATPSGGSDSLTIEVNCPDIRYTSNITISKKAVIIVRGNFTALKDSVLDLYTSPSIYGMLVISGYPDPSDPRKIIGGNLIVKNKARIEAANIFLTGTADFYSQSENSDVYIYGTFGAGKGFAPGGSKNHEAFITAANNAFTYPNGYGGTGGELIRQ